MTVKKRITWILLFTMVLIGVVVPFTYADAPSTWAQDIILEAKNHQLTTERILSEYQKPITREEFASEYQKPITREEFSEVAVKLYEALGGQVPAEVNENPFVDTSNPIVLQAHNLGIINGKTATHFAPDATITRQELSVMLVRTMKAIDPEFHTSVSDSMFFMDQDKIASWAMEEIKYLFDKGVIQGIDALRIDPEGLTTREQAIVMTMRAFKVYESILGQSDTLRIGQGADARTLDPHASNDQTSSRVIKQINETLVVQDENMQLQPGLAESWKKIDDLTFEFKLKQGVKFHNGEELKARDVKFTLLRALESPNVWYIVGAIDAERIDIVDDYTIRISTVVPFASLLAHLAHTGASILNEKAVIVAGDDYGMNPVGTGPFKFDSWNIGDSIGLVKFDDYHGEVAKVDRVVFKNIFYAIDRRIELETGGIDIAYDILPSDIEIVEENQDLILYRDANLSTSYIGFNIQKKPLDDVRVRQAINYAIDVESIIETVMEGAGYKANGPLGPNVWGANKNLEPYGYDVDKAKELLAEAGYEDGFKISIWTNDNRTRMDIVENVKNQLKAINIEVEVDVVEWGAYLDRTANGEHEMYILGWATVTGDADHGLYPLFHSEYYGNAGNRQFYANDRVDELLDKARIEIDPEKRKEYYMEAQEIIRDDAPWIFLYDGENLTGTRSNVKGFKHHPVGHHKLSGVYLQ